MILDDLRRVRASPEVPRLAVALFATAAAMLFALASTSLQNPNNAAPQVPVSQEPSLATKAGPAVAAPHDCQRFSVKRGKWLQAIVIQRDYNGREIFSCYYGAVQIRAGDANL